MARIDLGGVPGTVDKPLRNARISADIPGSRGGGVVAGGLTASVVWGSWVYGRMLLRRSGVRMDVKEFNLRAIERLRADRDVEGFEHLDLLLLTTTGAKSGRPHTTPLARRRDGDRLLVVAANTGGRKDPDWYVNILANSKVTVELGDETYEAGGIPLDGPGYDETWRRLKDDHPYLGEYELSAGRTIPVIVLVPSVTAVQAGR